ncbi:MULTISPECIES: TM1266 family iron-only hydrogenase system putative regulator [unclassified Ruminococcus]|uniref:TM1266 family iron-only hydrogenase system putative regulator n=1 Tax=unclassified Ruminococcus TaxID=2608920 RepID=UPI002109E9FF|nr:MULTISPECIES: TM1266 family iron-only hydrogenase system putative regulator [unclassified Ruminococcus]MCQ4023236.1 iron-only hydrogenase system regulator [Ruminococcus sp. zg-924]MCQ4115617.1 iron-only hydrogenase system regulator [Ruminococcus sp. zg-921]
MNDTRLAVIGIVVESNISVDKMNAILSEYGEYIIGRMGIPHRAKNVNVISVVLDAPSNVISALSGKLGRLEGINSKTLYSKV